jgi:hypothetical protein
MTARNQGTSNDGVPEDGLLEAAVHRRLTVAVCWAVSRRATLDSRELYEESYALNEEFREWLLCLEDHPLELSRSVLMVPQNLGAGRWSSELDGERRPETDGLLEI